MHTFCMTSVIIIIIIWQSADMASKSLSSQTYKTLGFVSFPPVYFANVTSPTSAPNRLPEDMKSDNRGGE